MDASIICSSKLFKTSNRQLDILAKINSLGVNIPLEIQDKSQINTVDVYNDVKDDSNSDSPDKEVSTDNKPKSSLENTDEKNENQDKEDADIVDDDVEGKEPEESKKQEDVSVDSSVSASTGCALPRTDVTDNLNLEVKDIKGLLNSNSDTSGVSRVSVKDDKELWIHYNDNVNLNDVMVSVIELVNQSGYSYLEFNRLARSENAIVFVIMYDDTYRRKKFNSELSQDS